MTPEGRPSWGQPPDEADQQRYRETDAEQDLEPWQDHLSMGLPRFGTPPNELWSPGLEDPSQEPDVPSPHGDRPATAEPFDFGYSFEQSPESGYDLPPASTQDGADHATQGFALPADSTQELSRAEIFAPPSSGPAEAVPPSPAPPPALSPSPPAVPPDPPSAPAPTPGSMPSWGAPALPAPPRAHDASTPDEDLELYGGQSHLSPPPVVEEPTWPPAEPDANRPGTRAPSFHHPGLPTPEFYGLPASAGSDGSHPSPGGIEAFEAPPEPAAAPGGYEPLPAPATPWHDGPSTLRPEPRQPEQSEPSVELTPPWGAPGQQPYQRSRPPSESGPTPELSAITGGTTGHPAPAEEFGGPSWARPAAAQPTPERPAAEYPPALPAAGTSAADLPDDGTPSYPAEPATSVMYPVSGLVPQPRLGLPGQQPPGVAPPGWTGTGANQEPASAPEERDHPEDATTRLPTGPGWAVPAQLPPAQQSAQTAAPPASEPSGVDWSASPSAAQMGTWPPQAPPAEPQFTDWPAPTAPDQPQITDWPAPTAPDQPQITDWPAPTAPDQAQITDWPAPAPNPQVGSTFPQSPSAESYRSEPGPAGDTSPPWGEQRIGSAGSASPASTEPASGGPGGAGGHPDRQDPPELGTGPTWAVSSSQEPEGPTRYEPSFGYGAPRPDRDSDTSQAALEERPATSSGPQPGWRSLRDIRAARNYAAAGEVPDSAAPVADPVPVQRPPSRAQRTRGGDPARRPRRKRGCLPTLILVTLVVLLTAGAVWYLSRDSGYAVGDCVMRGADGGVLHTSCADGRAYRVVKRVRQPEQCRQPDATVTLERGDALEVLCLKKVPKG